MAEFSNRKTLFKVVIALVAAFTIILGLFLILFFLRPRVEANTLEYELAKTCLQMSGIILFGAFVTLATFLFQKEWEQRRVDLMKESDNNREDTLRKSDIIREDLRRESDNLRDERERQDLALRAMLNQTLDAYNGVKRVRRILKSQTGNDTISKDAYEQQLLDLNDQQLTFEHLSRSLETIDDRRLRRNPSMASEDGPPYDLKAEYGGIESYLNRKIKEFEDNLHHVKIQGTVPLADLKELHLLVTNTEEFKTGISGRFTRIVETLQAALLVPLVLPMIGENPHQTSPSKDQDT